MGQRGWWGTSSRSSRRIAGWTVGLVLAFGLPSVGAVAGADAGPVGACGPFTALVANHGGSTVSMVGAPTPAPIRVGLEPAAVAVTPDGSRVVAVTLVGVAAVIDVATGAVTGDVSGLGSASAVAVTPDGSKALAYSSALGIVSVIDLTASRPTVSSSVHVGSGDPTVGAIAITPDGTKALVTVSSGSVSVLDLTVVPPVVSSTFGVVSPARGVAVTPDGTTAFVAHGDHSVSVVDLTVAPPAVSTTVNLPVGSKPSAVVVTLDGTTAFVANGNGTVSTITVSGLAVGGPIAVGAGLTGIAATDTAVLVTDSIDSTLSEIDIASLTVTGPSSAVGAHPRGIAVTPDGQWAFVADLGADSVSKIRVSELIDLGPSTGPEGVAVTPSGATALVANHDGDSVSVIDVATGAVVGSPVAVGDGPFGVAIVPDGSIALVTNENGGTVSVVDLAAAPPVVVSTVVVGTAPRGIAITPDGTRALVANSGDTTLSVLDLTQSPPVPVAGTPVALGGGPFAVAVAPTGSTAYVSLPDEDAVAIVDLAAAPPAKVQTLPLSVFGGEHPTGIAVAPDGWVYVANTGRDTVSTFGPVARDPAPAFHVPNGSKPTGLAISPDGQTLAVTNSEKKTVSVFVDINQFPPTALPSIPVGDGPAGIAFVPADCPARTTTTITSDSPDPTAAGSPYTVAGTVTVHLAVPVGSLPGSVTVSGEGSGCIDSTLTPTDNPNEFAFSCSVTAGVTEGSATLTATHVDSGTDFATSFDTEEHTVAGAVPLEPNFTG